MLTEWKLLSFQNYVRLHKMQQRLDKRCSVLGLNAIIKLVAKESRRREILNVLNKRKWCQCLDIYSSHYAKNLHIKKKLFHGEDYDIRIIVRKGYVRITSDSNLKPNYDKKTQGKYMNLENIK